MKKATQKVQTVLQSPQAREIAQAAFTAVLVVVHRQIGDYLSQRFQNEMPHFDEEDGEYIN